MKTDKKLLVIVPYRDRKEHLEIFLPYIKDKLQQQQISNKIIIIEQSPERLFNRGLLCNIGFLLYSDDYDYICIHDVDMICDVIDYSYSDIPLSLVRHRTKHKNVYKEYFGGIIICPTELFSKINGFSNNYWGWGCEDDDLRLRFIKNNINILYRDGFCSDLEINTDDFNRNNNPNYNCNLIRLKHYKSSKIKSNINDGLNTIKNLFCIKDIVIYNNHTKVLIDIVTHNDK